MSDWVKTPFVDNAEPDLEASVLNPILDEIERLQRFSKWSTARTYAQNDPVFYSGIPYRSLIAGNLNNQPDTNPDKWEVVGGSGQGVENFLKNALTKNNTLYLTKSAGVTSIAWDTSATAQKLLAAGALKAVIPNTGTRTLDIALSDLDAISVGQQWFIKFAYLIDTAAADGLVTVTLNNGTTDIPVAASVLSYAGGNAQYASLAVIPDTTLTGVKVRFTFTGSQAFNFYLAKASVGPSNPIVGAAGSNDIAYTPTITGAGTPTILACRYQRVGHRLKGFVKFTSGTATAVEARLSLPPGCTIASDSPSIEICGFGGGNVASTFVHNVLAEPGVAYVTFGASSNSNVALTKVNGSAIWASHNQYSYFFDIPIAEWSSNVNLAGDFTEYASNSSSTDADDTTSFAYGAGGSAGVIGTTALTANRSKRVRFTRPIQAGDELVLEFLKNGVWVTAFSDILVGRVYTGAYYGGINLLPVNSTDVDVIFYQRSWGDSSAAWNVAGLSGVKWRVRKVSNGNMAEQPPLVFGSASANSQSVTADNPFVLNTVGEDTHGGFVLATGRYVCKVAGVYSVAGFAFLSTGGVRLWKNGSALRYLGWCSTSSTPVPLSAMVRLAVGDYIDIRPTGSVSTSYMTLDVARIGA